MPATTTPGSRWLDRMFQMRLPVFMVAVAGCALISWAAILFAESRDMDRVMAAHQLGKLSSADAAERRSAAYMLDAVPPAKLSETARALIAILKGDPDPTVRVAAAGSLSTSVTHYFSATQGEVPSERDMATLALIAALRDADPRVRASAAIGLEGFSYAVVLRKGKRVALGLDPEVAVGPLRALLDDPDPSTAMAAYRALMGLNSDPAALLPALRYLAKYASPSDRGQAILQASSGIRSAGLPPDELLPFLDDAHQNVRTATASALGWHWSDNVRVARALARQLDKNVAGDRHILVWALARFQAVPDEAVGPLARAMDPRNAHVGDAVLQSQIWQLAPAVIGRASPGAIRSALPSLETMNARLWPHSNTAAWAILAGGLDTPEAARLIDRAVESLGDSSDADRLAAAQLLGEVGPPCAERAVGPLAKVAADDPNAQVSDAACAALGRLGVAAKGALPELLRLARSNFASGSFEKPILDAILAVDPASPEAVEAVAALAEFSIEASDTDERLAAALVLPRLAGSAVVTALEEARDRSEGPARARFDAALKTITTR